MLIAGTDKYVGTDCTAEVSFGRADQLRGCIRRSWRIVPVPSVTWLDHEVWRPPDVQAWCGHASANGYECSAIYESHSVKGISRRHGESSWVLLPTTGARNADTKPDTSLLTSIPDSAASSLRPSSAHNMGSCRPTPGGTLGKANVPREQSAHIRAPSAVSRHSDGIAGHARNVTASPWISTRMGGSSSWDDGYRAVRIPTVLVSGPNTQSRGVALPRRNVGSGCDDGGVDGFDIIGDVHGCATELETLLARLWVSPEIVEASFKLRPAGWQRFSRTRPEPARLPSCAVV